MGTRYKNATLSTLLVMLLSILPEIGGRYSFNQIQNPQTTSECDKYLTKIRQEAVTITFPSDLSGVWVSQRCEVLPGPEFVIRKYRFQRNNFSVEQFYYKDSECSTPLYVIMAKGRLKAQRWSMLVQGGTDTRYHLNSVRVLPYSSDAAWDLRRRAIQSCPYLGKLHWKPFHQYGILKTASHAIKDCTDRFGWTMNEFQLIKLEKRTIFHGYRIMENSELFTGAIHLDNTVRKHFYRPTDYQPALIKDENPFCKHCSHISAADPHHPPILPRGHHSPILVSGDWVSIICETRPRGMFLTRHITFKPDENLWGGTYRYYRDPYCREPSFTLVAEGKYVEMKSTPAIGGAVNYKFSVQRLKITPQHRSISENLNMYNDSVCGVPGSWRIGMEQDVTPTHGCTPLNIKLPNVVPETLKTVVEPDKKLLYIGQRVVYSGPKSRYYPTSFQHPLRNCEGVAVQSKLSQSSSKSSSSSSGFVSGTHSSSSSFSSFLSSSSSSSGSSRPFVSKSLSSALALPSVDAGSMWQRRRAPETSEAKPIIQLLNFGAAHSSAVGTKTFSTRGHRVLSVIASAAATAVFMTIASSDHISFPNDPRRSVYNMLFILTLFTGCQFGLCVK